MSAELDDPLPLSFADEQQDEALGPVFMTRGKMPIDCSIRGQCQAPGPWRTRRCALIRRTRSLSPNESNPPQRGLWDGPMVTKWAEKTSAPISCLLLEGSAFPARVNPGFVRPEPAPAPVSP